MVTAKHTFLMPSRALIHRALKGEIVQYPRPEISKAGWHYMADHTKEMTQQH